MKRRETETEISHVHRMIMMKRPSGLGRGLGALIPPAQGGTFSSSRSADLEVPLSEPVSLQASEDASHTQGVYREIPISDVEPNPHQPRKHFDHTALEDLVSSIRERGIIEPLVVTEKSDGKYELIAGERRLRAANIAGFRMVPCVVRGQTDDREKLELAIIENVQRHDLNPIEEAFAYQRLVDEFGLTQDEVGIRVGKSRPQVGNTIRLLQLPHEIQQALMERKISASNARTLLSLPTTQSAWNCSRAMLAEFYGRQAEDRVGHPRASRMVDPNIAEQEVSATARASRIHQTVVFGRGEIRIAFQSDEILWICAGGWEGGRTLPPLSGA